MNVIKYNVNSGDVCQIGRQYEYGKTQVIFEGYQVIDSANEIYFKFVGRTEESKYLIPIVDMTLDITQQLTKHVGQFSCQLEEMNTEGTLVSQSPLFYVAVKRSIKVGADYEVQDPRLETIYQKYNEMYNIISQTNETSLANESQRQAEWLTLKQEVSNAIDSFNADIAIGEFRTLVQTETDSFNTNAETKLNAYNQNDSQKTNAYNTNANNRVAEFDNHTEQIQADISELKSDLADIDKLLEHEVIKPYSQNGSATISTSWDYVHVLDNIELPTAKMYRFTFTIPSATTNVIYCRARKGTTTFLQLQIETGNTRVSLDKYCEPLDIDYLDATGDTNAVGLTVSATIEEIGGETIEKSIVDKVEMNPLYGKIVLFNGDSICASATDTEYNLAWAGRIMNRNSMSGKNYAVMGGTISSNNYRNDSSAYHWISASVDTMYSENPNADYIIFEGGTNDADLLGSIINGNTSERLGTFSLGDFSGNYDMNTFCGAFENLCYKATNYWTGKKIGYVVAYKMAGQSGLSSGYTKEKSNRRAYFDIAMQICEKWGIPVLNLWDNCYMNPSNVACYDPSLSEAENKSTKMIYDGQHPATKGYEYIYPIIESWMKTL